MYIVFIDFNYVIVFVEVYAVIYTLNIKKLPDIPKMYSCGLSTIDCTLTGFFFWMLFPEFLIFQEVYWVIQETCHEANVGVV